MAREFSRGFYKSAAWKACRDSYWRQKGGLCEDCLERGQITPGEEVHHVEELTPDNINDPSVALNWSNLQCVCRECHAAAHGSQKRWKIDENGKVHAKF